jgi:small-conductance mechanosensitive channel
MWLDGLRQVFPAALAWIRSDVLVPATLAQAACAVVLLGLVLLTAAPVRNALSAQAGRLVTAPAAQPLARGLAQVAPWILLLLLVWFAILAFDAAKLPAALLRLVESLAIAWVVIRLSSNLVRNPRIALAIAVAAWILAALNIAGLVAPLLDVLNAMAVPIGNFRLSVLLILKGIVTLAVLIWLANLVSRLVDQRLRALQAMPPAMQVLAAKVTRATLLVLAVVLSLGSVGIDLTAFAVFSGAIGVGVGFGLQKVVSNLISGVILLLDRSIKPGDVIEIEGTYGWITHLNARYVSVNTRDGKEHLIPNEDLITQRVVNWTYSNDLVRLHAQVGVSYECDPHEAIRLALQAIDSVPRVLKEPKPVCLLIEFGDSSINLEMRFWINDPSNGITNVKSQVLLNVWDLYQAHGIEIPNPQREVTVRNPEALAAALAQRSARLTLG